MADDLHDHEKRIEAELARIRRNTDPSWFRMFAIGMLRGAGFVAGTVLSIAIIGWLLSTIGVIPGFGDSAARLREILEARTGLP